MARLRLGELLVKYKALTEPQLEQALKAQRVYGGKLGTVLVELGFVSEDFLGSMLSLQFEVPAVLAQDLDQVRPEILEMVPAQVAERLVAVPYHVVERRLSVAIANPEDLAALDELRFVTGREVELHVATEILLRSSLHRYYDVPIKERYIRLSDDPLMQQGAQGARRDPAPARGPQPWDEGASDPAPSGPRPAAAAHGFPPHSAEARLADHLLNEPTDLGTASSARRGGGLVAPLGPEQAQPAAAAPAAAAPAAAAAPSAAAPPAVSAPPAAPIEARPLSRIVSPEAAALQAASARALGDAAPGDEPSVGGLTLADGVRRLQRAHRPADAIRVLMDFGETYFERMVLFSLLADGYTVHSAKGPLGFQVAAENLRLSSADLQGLVETDGYWLGPLPASHPSAAQLASMGEDPSQTAFLGAVAQQQRLDLVLMGLRPAPGFGQQDVRRLRIVTEKVGLALEIASLRQRLEVLPWGLD